jgi:hypothetical protein
MITLSDSTVANLVKSSNSIKIDSGCYIEYNINSMVNFTSTSITSTTAEYNVDGRNPFKKLFPADSIVKQFRPNSSGIKYYINGDVPSGSIKNPKNVIYDYDYRTYIPGTDTLYKYWISKKGGAVDIAIKYPKTILVNKVTVKFEISHSTPASWVIKGRNGNGSYETLLSGTTGIKPFKTSNVRNYDAGQLNIYFNGTTWSLNESDLNAAAYKTLTDVKLEVSAISGKYIGVIEIAPKMVKNISDDVISFNIRKESSSSGDLLPVGNVSANSLTIDLVKYDQSSIQYSLFNKSETQFTSNLVYLYKNAEIKPFFNIYTSNTEYVKVQQGTFFMDSWSISEHGETNIVALDGAKILMETICPDILLNEYSITSILRVLLDTVGFTNYNITVNSNLANENGIISPIYWWTQDSQTVWQAIQELCRDIQMTAVFDENNVLQFYSRDYFYDSDRTSQWTFSDEQFTENNIINKPSIILLNKQEMPTANKVKILWSTATTSNYLGDSAKLWQSEVSFLGAMSLLDTITNNLSYPLGIVPKAGEGTKVYMTLAPNINGFFDSTQTLYSYSGYVAIQSEIIEYDAIEYQYVPINGVDFINVDIESQNDIFKYRTAAQPGPDKFRPTGRYRIKTRGAFNTTPDVHIGSNAKSESAWPSYGVNWKSL